MNIGTATAPPANGVDDVNHADASGTAAVNKESCLVTLQTPTNDVEVLASARDDVVGETESARATPPRAASMQCCAELFALHLCVSAQILAHSIPNPNTFRRQRVLHRTTSQL
jgi:hypothetical protein